MSTISMKKCLVTTMLTLALTLIATLVVIASFPASAFAMYHGDHIYVTYW